MAELSELNLRLTGDDTSARAAINRTINALSGMDTQFQSVNANMKKLGPTMNLTAARMKSASDKMNRQLRTSRFHSANLLAQFNDIGVMMASGQNPFILAAQQGTQITQVLQSIGSTGKSQFAALRQAALAFIGPTQLVTFGVIAASAALVQWGSNAIKAMRETDQLADAMANLQENTAAVLQQIEIARFGDLTEEQAKATIQLNRNTEKQLEIMRDIADVQAKIDDLQGNTTTHAATLRTTYGEMLFQLRDQLSELKDQESEWQKTIQKNIDLNKELQLTKDVMADLVEDTQLWADAFTSSADDAERIAKAVEKISNTGTPLFNQGLTGFGLTGPELLPDNAGLPEDENTGGGRGGISSAEQFQKDLERLQEQLSTQAEIELEAFENRQSMLEEALEKKLLTQTQYNELEERLNRDHQKTMADIDVWRYGSTLQKTDAFLGGMADALSTGNADMLEIAKKFGAAQALISAWQGAAEALKLPFPQNLAAFAKVLATGLGAVQAIKGVQPGGTTTGAGRGGGAGPTDAGSIATQREDPARFISINFGGQQLISTEAAIGLLGQINEVAGEGLVIRGSA